MTGLVIDRAHVLGYNPAGCVTWEDGLRRESRQHRITLPGVTPIVAALAVVMVLAGCGGTARPADEPGVTLEPRPAPMVTPTAVPRVMATPTATAEPTPTMAPRDAVNVLGRRAVVALRDGRMDVMVFSRQG